MVNEIIQGIYYKGDSRYPVFLVINTDVGHYHVTICGFEQLDHVFLDGFKIYDNNFQGVRVTDVYSDAMMTYIKLSDGRLLDYTICEDASLEFTVEDYEFDEVLEAWFKEGPNGDPPIYRLTKEYPDCLAAEKHYLDTRSSS